MPETANASDAANAANTSNTSNAANASDAAKACEVAQIRPIDELDIDSIVAIDEKISGQYRPEVWERRIGYHLRRDPDASVVAQSGGRIVGFMLGEIRSGEFGLDEPTGWISVLGVDPQARGQAIGRRMAEAVLAHFKNQGATSVRTLVDEEMGEIAGFFVSLGFAPSSLRPFAKPL